MVRIFFSFQILLIFPVQPNFLSVATKNDFLHVQCAIYPLTQNGCASSLEDHVICTDFLCPMAKAWGGCKAGSHDDGMVQDDFGRPFPSWIIPRPSLADTPPYNHSANQNHLYIHWPPAPTTSDDAVVYCLMNTAGTSAPSSQFPLMRSSRTFWSPGLWSELWALLPFRAITSHGAWWLVFPLCLLMLQNHGMGDVGQETPLQKGWRSPESHQQVLLIEESLDHGGTVLRASIQTPHTSAITSVVSGHTIHFSWAKISHLIGGPTGTWWLWIKALESSSLGSDLPDPLKPPAVLPISLNLSVRWCSRVREIRTHFLAGVFQPFEDNWIIPSSIHFLSSFMSDILKPLVHWVMLLLAAW